MKTFLTRLEPVHAPAAPGMRPAYGAGNAHSSYMARPHIRCACACIPLGGYAPPRTACLRSRQIVHRLLLGLTLLVAGSALAQNPAPASLPEWDKLTPQQRETLIAPVRDRWNNEPQTRERMMDRAQRWKTMTPEQRAQARHGIKRFERMNPQQREQARALYEHMLELTPEQRKQLHDQWKQMTPEQRRTWLEKNPPKGAPPRQRDR
jgi:hypothetical protein